MNPKDVCLDIMVSPCVWRRDCGRLDRDAHHPWFRFLASFALGQEASLGASRAFTPSRAGATLTVEYE